MGKRIGALTVALGLLTLAPAGARASTPVYSNLVCTATAFEVCVNFSLSQVSGNTYQLVVTYVSTNAAPGQQGVMRAAGLYDPTAAVTFSSVTVVGTSTGQSWSTGCSSLGNPGFAWGCASATGVSSDMLPLGGSVTIQFTSSALLSATDFTSGNLGFRGMIQSLGPNSCSVKPDSRAPGNVLGGADLANSACVAVVPEPVTMVLVGSGLLGMCGVGLARRRRREGHSTTG